MLGEYFAARICLLVIDARKFSCAKICMFTVCFMHNNLPIALTRLLEYISTIDAV